MSQLGLPGLRVVLYEGTGSVPLTSDHRLASVTALLEAGHSVTCAATHGEVSRADDTPTFVLGRFEHNQPPEVIGQTGDTKVDVQDLAERSADDIVELVNHRTTELKTYQPGEWKPWFPVIDFDRCTNCMQCLSFCLFDVYGVDSQETIEVRNQDNCKTDCPACSRVCPEVAILFPKYRAGPINGAQVKAEDIQREAMKVDISTLLGGDLYGALRERSQTAKKRFSTERDESKALIERRRCLKKLGKDFDIPSEVLMTLPSVEDIQERADRAKAKAQTRRARSQTVKDQKPNAPSAEQWGI